MKSLFPLVCCIVLLGACGGGSDDDNVNTQPPGADSEIKDPVITDPTVTNVAETGGTIEVTDTASPIFGAKMEIPDQALIDAEAISLESHDDLPASFPLELLENNPVVLSKVIEIKRSGSNDFGRRAEVTIPFDQSLLPAHAFPVVVYWDEVTESYSPIEIKSLDRDNGTITFNTAHASKYVALFIDYLFESDSVDVSKLSVDVGFVPAEDSMFIPNFGNFKTPGGNCFGFAAYSAWYYHAKRSKGMPKLFDKYREGDAADPRDDQIARELISRVYIAGNQKTHKESINNVADANLLQVLEDRFTALSIIQQLKITKQPQILVMANDTLFSWDSGHAVTVYEYDAAQNKFFYYDNNAPGEIHSVNWSYDEGFGENSFSRTFDIFAFSSFNSAYSSATLNKLHNQAESGFNTSFFPEIEITEPEESTEVADAYFTDILNTDPIVLEGSVTRPADAENKTADRFVHVFVNGEDAETFPVDDSDTFELELSNPEQLETLNIMLLVSEHKKHWQLGLHGFKLFDLSQIDCNPCVTLTKASCRIIDENAVRWSFEGTAISLTNHVIPNTHPSRTFGISTSNPPVKMNTCSNWTHRIVSESGSFAYCSKGENDPVNTNWTTSFRSPRDSSYNLHVSGWHSTNGSTIPHSPLTLVSSRHNGYGCPGTYTFEEESTD